MEKLCSTLKNIYNIVEGNPWTSLGVVIMVVLIYFFVKYAKEVQEQCFDAENTPVDETFSVEVFLIRVKELVNVGIGLRVREASEHQTTLFFFADEDDFSSADLMELALLQNGDKLTIEYRIPKQDAFEIPWRNRDVKCIRNWHIIKLNERV